MPIQLYEHNARAYKAAVAMLNRHGKAAIVHPTGTGKSYIAFCLVADHPDERVLWLSPSEYIYKTQRENLEASDPELELKNLEFYTYAKLMQLSQEGLEQLAAGQPSYIILDEFHRCGAECWGQGVRRLLAACPNAKLLGLSATNVRYLDNQRDMAEELFDGCIASEMTLGEAIVRGILPAPKYVSLVYQYQKELERYQKRVENLKSPGIQDVNQKYLDALRRALEQADGLDRVFQRQIPEPHGKYIVFCAGAEHMWEMICHVPEWFGGVDPAPHVYRAYSEDPETDKAFAAFRADRSAHLKLLFCIDMLNEGVHVKDVSGVILFRPTVSPIVYKQQIGRALTAGACGTPLILDGVCNLEGLCSIGALQEEMHTAVQRMYASGEGGKIITERFEVFEQVRDCRVLFERLQNSLSSTWEQYFAAAREYAAEHGGLNVPKQYKTPGGLSLGAWITTQRLVREGKRSGSLTPQQIARLDTLGMQWGNRLEVAWQKNYEAAKRYYEAHGDLLVPANYKNEEGFALGIWLANLRQQRTNGQQKHLLCAERIALLDEIGMVWSVVSARWEQNYAQAAAYYAEHGDLLVPAGYRTANGFCLGAWVRALRQARVGKSGGARLTPQQVERLDAIGMYWGSRSENQWQKAYEEAQRYYKAHGDLRVPTAYVAPSGIKLGRWIAHQRNAYKNPKSENMRLTPERIARLEQIGMDWKTGGPRLHPSRPEQKPLPQTGGRPVPATYKTSGGWRGDQPAQ